MAASEDGIVLDHLFRNSKGAVVEAPKLEGPVADTHCHLDMLERPGLSLARCAYNNVNFVVTVVESSETPQHTYDMLAEWLGEASAFLDQWDVYAPLPTCRIVAGCHPQKASDYDKEVAAVTRMCAQHPLTSAIGEIGLDYYYDMAPHKVQADVFRRQIALAHELGKPIVMHIRDSQDTTDAHDEALQILLSEGVPAQGALLHCFTSDWQVMQPYLDEGCYVAFGGALTFAKSDDIRLAAAKAPEERILTETDSPYMSPVPLRGTVCAPENTVFTAQTLAQVRGVDPQQRGEFYNLLFQNALRFYHVDAPLA